MLRMYFYLQETILEKDFQSSEFKDLGYDYLDDCLVKITFESIWTRGSVVLISTPNRVDRAPNRVGIS